MADDQRDKPWRRLSNTLMKCPNVLPTGAKRERSTALTTDVDSGRKMVKEGEERK
ncbi:hypothetical protein T03_2625 [Trichinella britovi]|uniref:Uncharacterized protein n=2 Tax=Trichinella TaxID=6333 RepID=A0A0V1DFT6_TRIBR|nr:hypothetical protein T05_7283 [Trichinella murrelli]KRX84771.1 hypothetical protein T06_8090 [Trichinella sp. T6]KRY60232.1 hypothetical protein T03_2625 [Trichinella britovi]